MSSVFLLLNDSVVAGRMRDWIEAVAGFEVVGWVSSLESARQRIADARPELVLADLELRDGLLTSFLPELSSAARFGRPCTLVAALTLDDSQLLDALCCGAGGYFQPGRPAEALVETIQQALAGESAMAPEIARRLKAHFDTLGSDPTDFVAESLNPLQPNETERMLLQSVAAGYLPHEIARHLRITPNEVGRRIRTLYRKLQYGLRAASLSLVH